MNRRAGLHVHRRSGTRDGGAFDIGLARWLSAGDKQWLHELHLLDAAAANQRLGSI
jgi:hypothetical protein